MSNKRAYRFASTAARAAAAIPEPEDAQQGGWPREELIRMNARFVAAMETAFLLGLERRPDDPARAA